jgi:hypothetical protein
VAHQARGPHKANPRALPPLQTQAPQVIRF